MLLPDSPTKINGEDAGILRVLGGGGQKHQTRSFSHRLWHRFAFYPRVLLAEPHATEHAEQAGELHRGVGAARGGDVRVRIHLRGGLQRHVFVPVSADICK